MWLALLIALAQQSPQEGGCGLTLTDTDRIESSSRVEFDRSVLPDLVDASTLVCVGTVDQVVTVTFPTPVRTLDESGKEILATELKFGRIRIAQVMKGDPTARFAFHEVWNLGSSDQTSAWVERPCLFFLAPGVVAKSTQEAFAHASRSLGSSLILRSVFKGKGVVPIEGVGDERRVRVSGAPFEADDGAHSGTIRLSRLAPVIADLAEFAPENLTVHIWCERIDRRPGMRPSISTTFEARVLPSGRMRLATHLPGDEVTHSTIEPSRWAALQADLRTHLGGVDSGYNADRRYPIDRKLVVRIDGHVLTYKEIDEWHQRGLDAETQLVVERAMRSWKAVTDVVACPTYTDYRESDKRWLDGDR